MLVYPYGRIDRLNKSLHPFQIGTESIKKIM
jgi:hypothetical protein